MQSTIDYSTNISRLQEALRTADAVLIGAGAGLSTSAGYTYSGKRFYQNFGDFEEKYHFHDMYSGGFYPYDTLEEQWGFWSRYIYINRYVAPPKPVYDHLLALVKDKNYFVLTTNVDHCFQRAGFDKQRLFYTQGDFGLWQCSKPCHNKTYDNENVVRRMYAEQSQGRIPTALVPHCPVCGAPMSMNLRADDTFVQDEGWYQAAQRYTDFVERHAKGNVLFWELGVGANTPVIIKYPFWRMTAANRNATYACVNLGDAVCPDPIRNQSILLDADIGQVIEDLQ